MRYFSIDKVYNHIETHVDNDGAQARAVYAEKLELVFQSYESCLDLELALAIVPLSDDERALLRADRDLAARVALCDARVKEKLMLDLRVLATSASSEGVRLSAIKELGRTVYPERFEEKLKGELDLRHSGRVTVVDDV